MQVALGKAIAVRCPGGDTRARWIADSFPSMPPDSFAWADGATFAREWERDLIARAELAGASKDDALAAYEAFHARLKKTRGFC